MKKLFFFVLFVFAISGLSLTASADMSGPGGTLQNVVVSNEKGAEIFVVDIVYDDADDERFRTVRYDTGEFISYGTELELNYEWIHDGALYYEFESDDFDIEYESEYDRYFVKASDVMLIRNEVSRNEGVKLDEIRRFAVVSDDFCLYKGPGALYGTVSKDIPLGTVFTYEYFWEDSYVNEIDWVWAESDIASGWAKTYQYSYDGYCTASIVNGRSADSEWQIGTDDLYVIKEGVRLLNIPNVDEEYGEFKEISEEIPVGTRLEYSFYYKHAKQLFALVEYNGVRGWMPICRDGLYFQDVAASEAKWAYLLEDEAEKSTKNYFEFQVEFKEGMPVYGSLSLSEDSIIGHLEKGAIVKERYVAFLGNQRVDSFLRGIDYNGRLAWLYECYPYGCESESLFTPTPTLARYSVIAAARYEPFLEKESDSLFYDVFADEELTKKIGEVPCGASVIELFDNEYRDKIDYNGLVGFIDFKDVYILPIYDENNMEVYCEGYDKGYRLNPQTVEEYRRITYEKLIEEYGGNEPETTEEVSLAEQSETNAATTTEAIYQDDAAASASRTIVYSVFAAIILSLTAAVTVILVNKKKKEKEQ